jgi:hypothetical protein
MISNGEVITDSMRAEQFVSMMTGYRFLFDVGNSHRSFYWGYSLISSGEVITDAERMDDLVEAMTGERPNELCSECECFLSPGEIGICVDCASMEPDYGDEPDVDEYQEWYDFDPDC